MDGGWNLWTAWTPCSVTCGSGEQTRHRKCSNPEPVFGGKPCSGESTESKNCHPQFCSGIILCTLFYSLDVDMTKKQDYIVYILSIHSSFFFLNYDYFF